MELPYSTLRGKTQQFKVMKIKFACILRFDIYRKWFSILRTLSDMNGIGKINNEQFALAMYLVQQKLKGVEPPPALTPEMIPPSMRPKGSTDTTQFGVTVSRFFSR